MILRKARRFYKFRKIRVSFPEIIIGQSEIVLMKAINSIEFQITQAKADDGVFSFVVIEMLKVLRAGELPSVATKLPDVAREPPSFRRAGELPKFLY